MLLGAMCLCAAVGITYHECEVGFMIQNLQRNPSLRSQLSANQVKRLLKTPFAVFHAFMALSWTAIYAVKISFLVFFKKLITCVSKIHTYYWIVGVITLLSWVFVVVEPFIICRHPNRSFGKSYSIASRLSNSPLSNMLNPFSEMYEPFPTFKTGRHAFVSQLSGRVDRYIE